MVETLGHQQTAEEEKCGHGDFVTGDDSAGESVEGVYGRADMSEDDQQGGYQPDQVEIILLPVMQMVFQPLTVTRRW